MDDMRTVVNDGVVAFAAAETKLESAAKKAEALQTIFDRGNALGMMGLLQANEMRAKARAAAGLVAQAEVIVAALHREATDIAVSKGVDVPQPRSGGGGR